MTTTTQSRTVAAYDSPKAPLVNIARLGGTGPRRSGDLYRATVVSPGEIGDSAGRTLEAIYAGREGGHDVWRIDGSRMSGNLAFLTVQYGDTPKADQAEAARVEARLALRARHAAERAEMEARHEAEQNAAVADEMRRLGRA